MTNTNEVMVFLAAETHPQPHNRDDRFDPVSFSAQVTTSRKFEAKNGIFDVSTRLKFIVGKFGPEITSNKRLKRQQALGRRAKKKCRPAKK